MKDRTGSSQGSGMIEITASAHVPYQREHHENRKQHCKELLRDRHGRIRVKDPKRDRPVQIFLVCFMILELASMWIMEIDWAQIGEGISKIPTAFSKLLHLDFSQFGITLTALFESIAVAILSTIYSLFLGMILAVLQARNLTPARWISSVLSAVMTFLRAIPSIIWVLLSLICVGFGPAAASSVSSSSAPRSLPRALHSALRRFRPIHWKP